jgi:hypothetical protein
MRAMLVWLSSGRSFSSTAMGNAAAIVAIK